MQLNDDIWRNIGNIAAIITILGLLFGIARILWNYYHKSKKNISNQKITSSIRGKIENIEQNIEGQGKQIISATKDGIINNARQIKRK
jgi:hypothetical protein